MTDVAARPARWAVAAGLPDAHPGETLRDYAARIGLDYDELTEGLNEVTLEVANERMNTAIAKACPDALSDHIDMLCAKWNIRRRTL